MYDREPKSLSWVPALNVAPRGTTALECDVAGTFALEPGLLRGATFAVF